MVDRNAAETVNVETQSHQRVWIRLVFKRSRHRRLCSRMLGHGRRADDPRRRVSCADCARSARENRAIAGPALGWPLSSVDQVSRSAGMKSSDPSSFTETACRPRPLSRVAASQRLTKPGLQRYPHKVSHRSSGQLFHQGNPRSPRHFGRNREQNWKRFHGLASNQTRENLVLKCRQLRELSAPRDDTTIEPHRCLFPCRHLPTIGSCGDP